MNLPDNVTLGRARRAMMKVIRQDTKTDCPCCGRNVQRYRRHLHKEQADFMVELLRHGGDKRFIQSSTVMGHDASTTKSSTDAAYLVWPGIELLEVEGKGHYRITGKGMRWLRGRLRVPAWFDTMLGTVIGTAPEKVTIHEVLGTKFNIHKVLRPPRKVRYDTQTRGYMDVIRGGDRPDRRRKQRG